MYCQHCQITLLLLSSNMTVVTLLLNQRERQYQIIWALQLLLLNDSHTIVLLPWWAAFRSAVWLTEHQSVPGIPQRVKSIHLHAASYDQFKAAQRILDVLLYVCICVCVYSLPGCVCYAYYYLKNKSKAITYYNLLYLLYHAM